MIGMLQKQMLMGWVGMMSMIPSLLAAIITLPDFTELVSQNNAAVVSIQAIRAGKAVSVLPPGFDQRDLEGPFGEFLKRYFSEAPSVQDAPLASGSGFIITANGEVLTNQHVVEGADKILVRFAAQDYPAQVIGIDEGSDIALLKISRDSVGAFPYVKMGDSSTLKVGAWVLAIGSPFGLEHSVTAGIVSAKGRSLGESATGQATDFIQTDVAVNPGSSGGPLFNMQGEVVGINTLIYSRTGGYMGLSFAIPIEQALAIAAQLKQGKLTAAPSVVSNTLLGVTVADLTDSLRAERQITQAGGVVVTAIEESGAAYQAGIRVKDAILMLNNKIVSNSRQWQTQLTQLAAGQMVAILVQRDQGPVFLTLSIPDSSHSSNN